MAKILDNREMMALRVALSVEREKLEMFVKTANGDAEPYAQAAYRQRLEVVEGLLESLAPGARVFVSD